jgi:hypothetical protein
MRAARKNGSAAVSDQTKADLEDAISQHFADEFPGAFSSEWVLMVYGVHAEDRGGYYMREWPDGQPVHNTSGLLDYAQRLHVKWIDAASVDADDEDEE